MKYANCFHDTSYVNFHFLGVDSVDVRQDSIRLMFQVEIT